MFSRTRWALGLALLLTLLMSTTVLAKGGFSYITVTGADLKREIRLSDPALIESFFAFADFYRSRTDAPADPGTGYEIIRCYVDGKIETIFDRLHYYPETGYVFYDGIENGSSEYDDKWYLATAEIKSAFESALNFELRMIALGTHEMAQAMVPPVQAVQAPVQDQPLTAPISNFEPRLLILVGAGLTVLLTLALWFRKPSIHTHQPNGG